MSLSHLGSAVGILATFSRQVRFSFKFNLVPYFSIYESRNSFKNLRQMEDYLIEIAASLEIKGSGRRKIHVGGESYIKCLT